MTVLWIHDASGCLGEDRNVGQFTVVSHNGLNVVQYLLCRNADSKFENFCILEFNEFSDHSPVMYCLASRYTPEETNNTNNDSHMHQKIIYDETKLQVRDCLLFTEYYVP